MHRIFNIPELLREIFSHLSDHDNTVAARVCRQWFMHSVPFIWETAIFEEILENLSTFTVDVDVTDGFQQPLLPDESWRRFLLYSKNVRRLFYYQDQYLVFKHAELWRSCRVDLFSSKLTFLRWNGRWNSIEHLLPLLTSTLQILEVEVEDITNPNMLNVLCRAISARSLSLRAIKLSFPPVDDRHYAQAISRSLSQLCSHLNKLVVIHFESHCMTAELFTALSLLPRLQDLGFHSCTYLGTSEAYVNELSKQGTLDEEEAGKCLSFQSLKKLLVQDSGTEGERRSFTMVQILGRRPQLPKLVDLEYSFYGRLDKFPTFMDSVHTVFPNLQRLSLSVTNGLPWQWIRSLLNCPALVKLISHSIINLELEDIVTIATSRTSWKVIKLPSLRPLSYQALVAFAQNCPDLTDLTLTLDNELQLPDLETFDTNIQFSSLTSLDVDQSPLNSGISEVAMFLSSICRNPLQITSAYDNPHRSSWQAVNFLIKTQLEIRALKDENARLRAQVSIPGSMGPCKGNLTQQTHGRAQLDS